jgi:hypothetical protein
VLLSSTATATEADVVVIPGAIVKAWRPDGEDDRRGDDNRRVRSGATEEVGDDADDEPMPTDTIVTAPEAPSPSPATGGGSRPDAPVDDVTDALTGSGGPPASNTGGTDADKTVEDPVDDADKTVEDPVDDADKLLEDTTDELGDSLLGD